MARALTFHLGLEKRRTRSRTITDSHAWAQQRLREIEREGKDGERHKKAEGDIADETLFLREGAAMKIKRGAMIKNGGGLGRNQMRGSWRVIRAPANPG